MRDLVSFQEEMNRLFNDFFSQSPAKSERGDVIWDPLVDISETENEIVVHAEIPGMKKEDVKINIQDNVLTISGEKKRVESEKEHNYHRIERAYGCFERSFSLPSSIELDKVKATYKDGILTISLPKTTEEKPKEVSIDVK
jgi:HSP20 family protein